MSGTAARGVRQLPWRLSVLLLLAAAAVLWVSMQQLRDAAQEEARARAQLVADAVASRIERAVALGIPLDRLEGVEALFAQRMQGGDVRAVALQAGNGRTLWRRSREQGEALPAGPQARSTVAPGGREVAQVVLVWREPAILQLFLRWALPIVALVAALAALAAEALRAILAGGPLARETLLAQAGARVGAGGLDLRLPHLPRREFDARLPWLARELRFANEQYLRVRRLVHSLRSTEPEAARRAALDHALLHAEADDRFRAEADVPVPGGTSSHGARGRWPGVLAGAGAWLAAAGTFALARGEEPVGAVLLLAGVLLLVAGVARRGPRFASGCAAGLLAIGPGLALPMLLLAGDGLLAVLGVAGNVLLAWSVLAAAVLAVLPASAVAGEAHAA